MSSFRARPCRRALLILAALMTMSVGPARPDAPVAVGGTTDALIVAGLEALHRGRFSAGMARFEEVLATDPRDPRGHLFLAFTEWWRRLELETSSSQTDLEQHLNDSIRLARERLDQLPEDPDTLNTLGTGQIFLAQYLASQRKAFRAALAAKKGKRYLEKALALDASVVDSRFALGAYNYYADKVNLLVKGLRTILFLPGGDSEKGLEQLRYVARHGRYFRTEAHLLLAIIYQGHGERRFLESFEHLRAALALNPDSPLVMASLGEFQIRIGRYREAQATFRDCLTLLADVEDPDQSRLEGPVRVLLAESLELSLLETEALQELAVASSRGSLLFPKMRWRALMVATRTSTRAAAPEVLEKIFQWLEVGEEERASLQRQYGASKVSYRAPMGLEPALGMLEAGQTREARSLLSDLLRRYPENVEIRFHLARSYFGEGRWEEAERFFREVPVGEGQAMSPWLEGWRELYLGRLMQLQGRRQEAKDFYTRAAELRGFRSRDLARALLGPEGPDERLWPKGIFGSGLDQRHDAADVGASLSIGGNSPRFRHRPLAGVIGREG